MPNKPTKRFLSAILLICPTALQAQQTYDLAIDYYVGRAVQDAGTLRDQVTIDFASRMVVGYFFRVQANQDGVVSADDTLDYIKSFAANRNFSSSTDFAKYDLNQDGVTTQNELEVSLSQNTWVTASTVYAETQSRLAVEERFQELISERTTRLRDRVGVAPGVDIRASGETYFEREDLQQLLNTTHVWGPPFFLLFDTNSNLEVDFVEFTVPVVEALLTADIDGDGVFSMSEKDTIGTAHDTADAVLQEGEDRFTFPDPR